MPYHVLDYVAKALNQHKKALNGAKVLVLGLVTSPSWPVSVTPVPPVSGSASEASTNSTSPPAPVTARPVATPGTASRSAVSGVWRGRPR